MKFMKLVDPFDQTNFILQVLLVLITTTAFSYAFIQINFNGFIDYDSQAFSAIGYHLLDGKVLYKDVWDAKPFGVYELNSLAIYLFGVEQQSIWILQLIMSALHLVFFFKLIDSITHSRFVALLSTCFYSILFYFTPFYQGGNFTEEYAQILLIGGVYFGLRYYKEQSLKWIFGSVTLLVSSTFFKEPYGLSILPWALFITYMIFKRKRHWHLFWVLIFGLLPFFLYFLYLLRTDSTFDYWRHLVYNFSYSDAQSLPFRDKIIANYGFFKSMLNPYVFSLNMCWLLIVAGLAFAGGRIRIFLVLFLVEFLLGWISISLTGYQFQHYFMQVLSSFTLLLTLSMFSIVQKLQMVEWLYSKKIKYLANGIAIIILIWFSGHSIPQAFRSKQSHTLGYTKIVDIVKSDSIKNKSLFIEDISLFDLYIRSETHSQQTIPVGFFSYFTVQDEFAIERIDRYINSFYSHPPTYIVTGVDEGMVRKHHKLKSWFIERYKLVEQENGNRDSIYLYQNKSTLSLPEPFQN
ncbi:MAG: hypothetical protein ACI9NN_002015 [Bacteroidia bacterium]|jgi:hypothetical protein